MALAIINPALAAGASSATAAVQLKYQRQLEEEADYRGLQYMRQAGFDPHGMPQFLKKMSSEDRFVAAQVPPYLLSHPLSQDRLSYIERILRTVQWNQSAPSDPFELARVQAILRTLAEPRGRLVAEYQQKVTDNPGDAKALALLGTVLLHYNDVEHARQALEQAGATGVRLDRDLGAVYLRLGQQDRARQAFARQREIDPSDAEARSQLCKLLWQEGNAEYAEKECRVAIEIDPQLDEAYLTLAQITGQQGKRAESRLLLAQAMEGQGRLEAALSQYQQASQALGPEHPKASEIEEKQRQLQEVIGELGRSSRR
jgi:predicted Zn-dependent protease